MTGTELLMVQGLMWTTPTSTLDPELTQHQLQGSITAVQHSAARRAATATSLSSGMLVQGMSILQLLGREILGGQEMDGTLILKI